MDKHKAISIIMFSFIIFSLVFAWYLHRVDIAFVEGFCIEKTGLFNFSGIYEFSEGVYLVNCSNKIKPIIYLCDTPEYVCM